MAFDKFDPHRSTPDEDEMSDASARRVWLLKWGWWISAVYTAVGFGFIAYWLLTGA